MLWNRARRKNYRKDAMSSPARESGTETPIFTTPRARIAALFAQIDSSSTPSPPRLASANSDVLHSSNTHSIPVEVSGEESDDDLPRPLGRAARKMYEQPPTTSRGSPLPEIYSGQESVYEQAPMYDGLDSHSLFVSPAKSTAETPDGSATGNVSRFRHMKKRMRQSLHIQENANPDDDKLPAAELEDFDRILSSATKPTRQASKRAILEIERETQRLAREQTLAHQVQVKTKFTTSSLFQKFNFLSPDPDALSGNAVEIVDEGKFGSDSSQARSVDDASTPSTSPPTQLDLQDKNGHGECDISATASTKPITRGQDSHSLVHQFNGRENNVIRASVRTDTKHTFVDDSSDDDLLVLPSNDRLSVFERAKGRTEKPRFGGSSAIHTLKRLSYQDGAVQQQPKGRKGISLRRIEPQVLQVQLRLRAKEQARLQELERIEALRMKGVEVLTAEQREKEEEELEDMFDKARQEQANLQRLEKAARASRRQGVEPNEQDLIPSDDESEEDEFEEEESETCNSDSEINEYEDLEDRHSDEQSASASRPTFTSVELAYPELKEILPSEIESKTQGSSNPAASTGSTSRKDLSRKIRHVRKSYVIDDEDEYEDLPSVVQHDPATRKVPAVDAPSTSRSNGDDNHSVTVDPLAAFGFEADESRLLMSPTQAFNATMQTSTQASQRISPNTEEALVLNASPTATAKLEVAASHPNGQDTSNYVPATHTTTLEVTASDDPHIPLQPQLPATPLNPAGPKFLLHDSHTPGWEPTQDSGLPISWQAPSTIDQDMATEAGSMHETQSTVVLRISESPAPEISRRRIYQGTRSAVDEGSGLGSIKRNVYESKNAFREMGRRRKVALTAAEAAEAQHHAREMMDEQAEESEDEYAGLGGDDFVAPETEEDRAIIDSSHVDVDEAGLAAHFAERQRVAEEAAASRLYKDLTTGALRRKSGNLFDLGDDEDSIAVRRRQTRQREEARRRAVLLRDDNIAGLANGKTSKGKDAFLKALADNDNLEDDLLSASDGDLPAEPKPTTDSAQPSIAAETPGVNKRPAETFTREITPMKHRRTRSSDLRAPRSIMEIQRSVSDLLHDSTAIELRDNHVADSRNIEDPARDEGTVVRTTEGTRKLLDTTVDRLSLKRSETAPEQSGSITAWAASSNGGFKAPALLRRATTKHQMISSAVMSDRAIGHRNDVKRGGGKKSSLAYQARAEERRSMLNERLNQRAEQTARLARTKHDVAILAHGVSGRFE